MATKKMGATKVATKGKQKSVTMTGALSHTGVGATVGIAPNGGGPITIVKHKK